MLFWIIHIPAVALALVGAYAIWCFKPWRPY